MKDRILLLVTGIVGAIFSAFFLHATGDYMTVVMVAFAVIGVIVYFNRRK